MALFAILAMPPYDEFITPALRTFYPDAEITVEPWPTENLTLTEIEESANVRVRSLKPDLVLIAVPRSAASDNDETFAASYAWVKARVGQGIFRDQVLKLWSCQCSVTGCGIQEALRASHIKPWSESKDSERLDPYSGLPLLATLDALFDKHLISFDPQGKMLISSELSMPERELLLPSKRRLRSSPNARTARLLDEHSKLLR